MTEFPTCRITRSELNDRSIEHRIADYLVDVLGNPKEIETGPLIALVEDAIADAPAEKRREFMDRISKL